MSKTVTVQARRPRSPAMFADLLPDVSVTSFQPVPGSRGWLTVTFGRDLTADELTAITDRLESTDDADMVDRAALRDLAAVVEVSETGPVADLLLALTARVLNT